ncbi:unnamed protein product [Prunus armeniaca]
MDIKRTSTLSSTTLTSQPLPTVVWITEKSKKLAGFYPKSPLLVRAIPSTIFFDPGAFSLLAASGLGRCKEQSDASVPLCLSSKIKPQGCLERVMTP